MRINNKYIIYKTVQSFINATKANKIPDDSIVFVIEDRSIHTHGMQFGSDTKDKGFFVSADKLPNAIDGDHAVAKDGDAWYLYIYDEATGWTKAEEYNMPDLTQEMLDKYIKKENIQQYLRQIYNNTYVRRDEIYTPDQEGWIDQAYDESDEWQWDEAGNLYRVDSELSYTSRNAVQNRIIANTLQNKKDSISYETYDEFLEDLERGRISDNAIIYIKDRALIYAYGQYFSGGGGGGGGIPVRLDTPILYRTVINRDETISTNKYVYNEVTELTSSCAYSIALENNYLHIAVPTSYSISKVVTSNNETLSIDDDFEKQTVVIAGISMNVYKYTPVIPPTLTLTFTFNIPQ